MKVVLRRYRNSGYKPSDDASTAGHGAARLPEANRCEQRGAVISNRDAAGTAMPSVSGAIGTGAAKGSFEKM